MRLDRVTVVCVTAMGAMFFAPCDVVAQEWSNDVADKGKGTP